MFTPGTDESRNHAWTISITLSDFRSSFQQTWTFLIKTSEKIISFNGRHALQHFHFKTATTLTAVNHAYLFSVQVTNNFSDVIPNSSLRFILLNAIATSRWPTSFWRDWHIVTVNVESLGLPRQSRVLWHQCSSGLSPTATPTSLAAARIVVQQLILTPHYYYYTTTNCKEYNILNNKLTFKKERSELLSTCTVLSLGDMKA
jgi:hypothetical protein